MIISVSSCASKVRRPPFSHAQNSKQTNLRSSCVVSVARSSRPCSGRYKDELTSSKVTAQMWQLIYFAGAMTYVKSSSRKFWKGEIPHLSNIPTRLGPGQADYIGISVKISAPNGALHPIQDVTRVCYRWSLVLQHADQPVHSLRLMIYIAGNMV